MAKKRIHTEELAELLLQKLKSMNDISTKIEHTSERVLKEYQRPVKLELTELKEVINKTYSALNGVNNSLNKQSKQVNDTLVQVKEYTDNVKKTSIPLKFYIFSMVSCLLFFVGGIVFSFQKSEKERKEFEKIQSDRNAYLKILQQIPKKEFNKYYQKAMEEK